MNESASTYRVLRRLALSALKAGDLLEKWGGTTRVETGRFLAQLMLPEERETFSMERYSASTWAPQAERGLPDWEREWYQKELPASPARLLVPGCGTGREVLPLLAQGYEVVAFDGALGPLDIARRHCGGRADLRQATYRQLVDLVDGIDAGPLAEFTEKKFDAIILGWGSLTHVAGAKERRRVLQACAALTDGPILTSFYSLSLTEIAEHETKTSTRLGRAIASRFRSAERGPSVVEFSGWGGFAEYLTKEEIALHGAALGRNVDWNEGGNIPFPFVTLRSIQPVL